MHWWIRKTVFNNAVKDVLDNNKAIGITRGTVLSSHAVTLWGFEFLMKVVMQLIYNDMDLQEKYGIGCMRLKVQGK